MVTFSAAQVRKFAPLAKDEIVNELVASIEEINAAGITTPERLWGFMANISPETAGLRKLDENLNYTAAGLRKTFPTRVTSDALAKQLAHQPQKIANFIYGGRYGNNKKNDGWIYRGGGLMMTTFRDNYRDAGFENNPEALRQPGPALQSALHFWKSKNCNRFADRGDIEGLRRVINGGANGLKEVRAAYKRAKVCFPGTVEEAEKAPRLSKAVVMVLQQQLIDAGYFPGAVDGKIGQQTIGEITKFQVANSLKITGEFDEATRELLENPPPRLVERAHKTPPDSGIVSGADKLIKGGMVTILGAGSTEVFEHIETAIDKFGTIRRLLKPIGEAKDFILSTIGMPGVIIIVAGVVIFVAWQIRKSRIKDYLSGKTA